MPTMHFRTVDSLSCLTNQLKPSTNCVEWTAKIWKEDISANMVMAALWGTIPYISHSQGIATRSQMVEVVQFL